MRYLVYAVDLDTGLVVSRQRPSGDWAYPIIDFDQIGQDGDFTGPMPVHLEKWTDRELYQCGVPRLRWTKKIPVELKNRHRAFWGMKPLKVSEET